MGPSNSRQVTFGYDYGSRRVIQTFYIYVIVFFKNNNLEGSSQPALVGKNLVQVRLNQKKFEPDMG